MKAQILVGDSLVRLRQVPDESVQCVVTSPPYWGLRDYGVEGQLGLERTPEEYVVNMVEVFRDVRRVLRNNGTCWVNMGDCYAGSGRGGNTSDTSGLEGTIESQEQSRKARGSIKPTPEGLKQKDLVGMPWMLAFALRADGWWLRQDIIWSKPNPMPESVTDRCTKAHEYLFLLTKSAKYYFDAEAIKEPSANAGQVVSLGERSFAKRQADGAGVSPSSNGNASEYTVKETRNKRDVWTVATQPYSEAHFATFPEALVEPCILAGSKVGDTVLDPFCGSGTTGVVALRYRRDFVGIELNESYAGLAEKRIGREAPMFNDVSVIAPDSVYQRSPARTSPDPSAPDASE